MRRHPLVRELVRDRFVTALFIAAVAFVVAHAALLTVKEVFPGGARTGNVLFELAIAYLGAWVFNLLVIVRPRVRARSRVLAGAGPLLERLSEIGTSMPAMLATGAHVQEPPSTAFTADWIVRNGASLRFGMPSPYSLREATRVRPATWQEWISDVVGRVASLNAALVPYFPYLEIELIGRVNAVVLSQFLSEGRSIAAAPAPAPGSMSDVADPLEAFVSACRELSRYYLREVAD